uniref:Uncharacterized protein n=1 Tax=Cajanus cajan TaxID=3821 RepID=A0A151UIN9_CAJCA
MLSRRERGLCYNCDEKFHPGHKCKARFFLLVAEEDDDSTTPEPSPLDPDPDPLLLDNAPPELSSAQINGGSTHNFIQTRIAKFLNLPMQPTTTLKVMVGNGSVIECTNICPAVQLSI